jgi:RHS repeat-associated protein
MPALAEAEPRASSSPPPLSAMTSPVSVSWPGTGYGNKAFTGREWDPEVQLYYYRARYYDPKPGRFVSEDPLRFIAGNNFYTYVENNPINHVDPLGLESGNINQMVPGPGNTPMFPWPPGGPPGSTADDGSGAIQDFWRNYRDMRQANTIGADKYFHCMANCQASRRGPASCLMARRLSNGREWFDMNVKGDPPSASAADQVANIAGRNGNPNVPCSQVCAPFRPNGLPPQY